MEFSMVTGSFGASSILLNRSQPSSALWCDIHPLKTLPAPTPSLAAKPSALIPERSRLLYESEFRTKLCAGQN